MPSIVFEAKDGAGNDVGRASRSRWTGSGCPDKLSGLPCRWIPGEHRFVFEAEGLPGRRRPSSCARGNGTGTSASSSGSPAHQGR